MKAIRKSKKLTQQELADRMERSVDAVSNLERGKSLPNFETVELLCRALNVPLKTLFDFDDVKLSLRKTQLLEELQTIARELSEHDLDLAVEQVRAIKNRAVRK